MGAFRYAAAHAAVRGDLGGLLEERTWRRLLSASGLEEILSVLSGTPYGDAVVDLAPEIETVEIALRGAVAERFRLPLTFLRGRGRDLLDWLWRSLEVDNLIKIIRGIHGGVPGSRIRSMLVDLGSASGLPWDRMAGAGSIPTLIDRIGADPTGRAYAKALRDARNAYERKGSSAVLEMALNGAYHRKLVDLTDSLRVIDRREARTLICTLVDGRNFLWVYRARQFFRLAPETILSHVMPPQRYMDAAALQDAAAGAPLMETLRRRWKATLPGVEALAGKSEREALVALEFYFRRHLCGLARHALLGNPFHLGAVLAHTFLVESELDDLITVLEGRVNGVSPDRIRGWLIGPGGRS